MHHLKDLLPSEKAKQGDTILRVAAELLEQHKHLTDGENYNMARGLLTRCVSRSSPAGPISI
jgi:hypothetical protein